jgi:hypothetical protein
MGHGQYHCRREHPVRRWQRASPRIRGSVDHWPCGAHCWSVWLQDSAQVRTLLLDGHASLFLHRRRLWRQTLCQSTYGHWSRRDIQRLELRHGYHWISNFLVTCHCWYEVLAVPSKLKTIAYPPSPVDYAVYMRETTKPWKVFFWTWSGLFFSQFLIELLGAALMTTISGSDAFTAAYNARGVGGLTGQIFEGYGTNARNFGRFIQAILSFSVVAVVITNVYSLGLNFQIISDHLMKVPRLIWSLLGGAAFLVRIILLFPSLGMHY